ncbi:restriction endonuclease subunit S [Cytophagaceae bacterium ABcell3]|nr:restriction endonuclease subunit S [Cytophagaceae bacterium ABcell3]
MSRKVKLFEVADIFPSNVDKVIHKEELPVKLCNYMDVYNNRYIHSRIIFSDGSVNASELVKFQLIKNDVLITKDSETPDDIAVPSVITEDIDNLVCGYHLALIRPFNCHGEFLMHYLLLDDIKKQFSNKANGSTRYGLTLDSIRNISLNLPPLPIQRKIAQILSTVDGQIEKTEAIIEKYKAIKQGLLQDLFTRGIDVNTGKLRPAYKDAPHLYKDSPLGMVPKEWEVVRLEKVLEKVGSGKTPLGGSEVYQESGVLFIRSQNVLVNELSLEDVAFISEAIDTNMASTRVKPYDVLLNITGASIGRATYFPLDLKVANVNQHVCILRPFYPSFELALFLSEYLNDYQGQSQIFKLIAGGNREGLNFQQIKAMHFIVPKHEEMILIINRMTALNKLLKSELSTLTKLLHVKQGLMSDLLSGRKEVKVEGKLEVKI